MSKRRPKKKVQQSKKPRQSKKALPEKTETPDKKGDEDVLPDDRLMARAMRDQKELKEPVVTENIDLRNRDIEEGMRKALSPGEKHGDTLADNYRMNMSVWACDTKVFTHPTMGPLRNGFPVTTFRPDDGGAPQDLKGAKGLSFSKGQSVWMFVIS